MFQAGGSVTYSDGRTQTFDVNQFAQTIQGLPDNELFALKNSADGGLIVFSPELKAILDNEASRKSVPFIDALNLGQKTGSFKSGLQDYKRVARGFYGPVLSGLTNLTFSKEAIEGDPRLSSVSKYDSPFFGEGKSGFAMTALRGGRSQEELESIIRGDNIQDFSDEIEEIEAPEPEVASVDPIPVDEIPTDEDLLPDPVLVPKTESETLGQAYAPGTVGGFDLEARRMEYEKSLIGRDEFGNLLPEGRLEQDDEITQAIKEILPAEMKIDIDRTEADTIADTQAKFDGTFEIEKPGLIKVDTTVTEKDEETRNTARIPVVPKETTGLFGSDRFLDFIRNVGGQLVATGQMGEGLATGAAKAAEERTARELLKEQEEKKFANQKRLLEIEANLKASEGMDYKEAKSLGEAEDNLISNLTNFQKSERTLKDLDDVFKDLEDPNAYGATGWLQESMDKLAAAAGMSTGDWKDLSARSRINATLEVLTQASVREVLGESGKTISNLDRQIVADIFGNLTIFTDPSVIKDKLRRTRTTVLNSMEADQGQIIKNLSYFGRTGATSPLVSSRQSLIDQILSIDLTKLTDPMSYLGSSVDTGITTIDYKAPGT